MAWLCVEHLENADQATFDFGEPLLCVSPEQFLERRRVGFFQHWRRFVFDAAAHAGERQAVIEDELFDSQNPFDV
jgi:hypothetical protein